MKLYSNSECRYQCVKTVSMDNSGDVAFSEGKVYTTIQPKGAWPPDDEFRYCFIDDLGKEHFADVRFIYDHFIHLPQENNSWYKKIDYIQEREKQLQKAKEYLDNISSIIMSTNFTLVVRTTGEREIYKNGIRVNNDVQANKYLESLDKLIQVLDETQENKPDSFEDKFRASQKDIEPEIGKIVSEKFFDMVGDDKPVILE